MTTRPAYHTINRGNCPQRERVRRGFRPGSRRTFAAILQL